MKELALKDIQSKLSNWPKTESTERIIFHLERYQDQPFYTALILETCQYVEGAAFSSQHCTRKRVDYAWGIHRYVWLESEEFRELRLKINALNPLSALDIFKILFFLQWQQITEHFKKDQFGFIIKLCLFVFLLPRLPSAKGYESHSSIDRQTDIIQKDFHKYWIEIESVSEIPKKTLHLSSDWLLKSSIPDVPEFINLADANLVTKEQIEEFDSMYIPIIFTKEIAKMSAIEQANLLEAYILAGASIDKIIPHCDISAFTVPASGVNSVILTTMSRGDVSILEKIVNRTIEILQSRQLRPVSRKQLADALQIKLAHILIAAASSQLDVLEYLLSLGFNPSASFDKGYSALHMAAAMGNADMVKILKNHGAKSTYTITSKLVRQQSLIAKYENYSLYFTMQLSPSAPAFYYSGYPHDFAENIGLKHSGSSNLLDLFPEEAEVLQRIHHWFIASYLHSPLLFSASVAFQIGIYIAINVYLYQKTNQIKNQRTQASKQPILHKKEFRAGREIGEIFKPVLRGDKNKIILKPNDESIKKGIIELNIEISLSPISIKHKENEFTLKIEEVAEALEKFAGQFNHSSFHQSGQVVTLTIQYPLENQQTEVKRKINKFNQLLRSRCSAYQDFLKAHQPKPVKSTPLHKPTLFIPSKSYNLSEEQSHWKTEIEAINGKIEEQDKSNDSIIEDLKNQCSNCQELIKEHKLKANTRRLEKNINELKNHIKKYKEINRNPMNMVLLSLLQLTDNNIEPLENILAELKSIYKKITQDSNSTKEKIDGAVQECQRVIKIIKDKVPTAKIQQNKASEASPNTETVQNHVEDEVLEIHEPSETEAQAFTELHQQNIPDKKPSVTACQQSLFNEPLIRENPFIEKYQPHNLPASKKNKNKGKKPGKKNRLEITNPMEHSYNDIRQSDMLEDFKQPSLCGWVLQLLLENLDKTKGNSLKERAKIIEMRHILRHHLMSISIADLDNFYNLTKKHVLTTAISYSNIYKNKEYQGWLKNKKLQKKNKHSKEDALWFLHQQLNLLQRIKKVENKIGLHFLLRCLFIQIGDLWQNQPLSIQKEISSSSNAPVKGYLDKLIKVRNRAAHEWTATFIESLTNKLPELDNIIKALENHLELQKNEPSIAASST